MSHDCKAWPGTCGHDGCENGVLKLEVVRALKRHLVDRAADETAAIRAIEMAVGHYSELEHVSCLDEELSLEHHYVKRTLQDALKNAQRNRDQRVKR